MRVLVTGASGFIGKWLTRRLLEVGHDVRVLGRSEKSFQDPLFKQTEKFYGDISDSESVTNACEGVDLVFHLAGLVGYSRAMHQAMVIANVVGTQNVVDACKRHKVAKLIHMSSVVAVGASFDGAKPLTEDSKFNLSGLNLGYFETKRKAEEIVLEAARKKEVFALCLNPSTVYGAGDAEKGSRKTQVKVAQGKFPFYTSGGVNVVHVEDVVSALLSAVEKGKSGHRYILAGENISIKQLFRIIAAAAGVKPPSIYLPNWLIHRLGALGDSLERYGKKGPLNSETAWTSTLFHWFDASKAKSELDFHPRPAKQAIEESVHWMKEQGLLA